MRNSGATLHENSAGTPPNGVLFYVLVYLSILSRRGEKMC